MGDDILPHSAKMSAEAANAVAGRPQRAAHAVQDARTSRMNRPRFDFVQTPAGRGQPRFEPIPQVQPNQVRYTGGQRHVEAVVADAPRHCVIRISHQVRAASSHMPCFVVIRRRPPHQGRGTVSKKGVGDQTVSTAAVLKMQAAQFYSANQHDRLQICFNEGLRCTQSVEGPWQPIKPMCNRPTVGGRPNDLISPMSGPGAKNPVQETVIK